MRGSQEKNNKLSKRNFSVISRESFNARPNMYTRRRDIIQTIWTTHKRGEPKLKCNHFFVNAIFYQRSKKMRVQNELSGKSLPSPWAARDIIRQSVRTRAHTQHTGRVRENHWVLKSVNNKRKMKNIRLVVVGIVLSLLRGPLTCLPVPRLNVQWEDASALLPARSEWVGALDVA